MRITHSIFIRTRIHPAQLDISLSHKKYFQARIDFEHRNQSDALTISTFGKLAASVANTQNADVLPTNNRRYSGVMNWLGLGPFCFVTLHCDIT